MTPDKITLPLNEPPPRNYDADEAIEALESYNEPMLMVECPCGHTFDAMNAPVRGENSGRFFNESVARSDINAPAEFQCPKCLLWQKAL